MFELIPGVSLRYVDKVQDLKNPDMIIIPGTKNTIGDLKWLRQSGFEAEILKHANKGTVIFGVCGGYQMLGKNLSDPYGVEEGGDTAGIGLLDVETIFAEKKRTIRVDGHFGKVQGVFANLSGKEFYGYEIHSGVTEFDKDNALTLAVNQGLNFLIPTVAAYTIDIVIRNLIKQLEYKYSAIQETKISTLAKDTRKTAERQLSRQLKGFRTLAGILTFTMIYRFITPVVITPVANSIGRKINEHKAAKKAQSAEPKFKVQTEKKS